MERLTIYKNGLYSLKDTNIIYAIEKLGKLEDFVDINKNVITLEEFWNSDKKIVIHCDTKEKAIRLLNKFNKLNKNWINKESYSKKTYWNLHKNQTCYSNKNECGSVDFYNLRNITIYEYEDVIC